MPYVRKGLQLVSEVEGILRGYLALWGSPQVVDHFNTYFSREAPPEMALDYLPRPILYEHGQDGGVRKEIVGSVTRIWFDERGIAFEGKLDRSCEYFPRMVAELKAGDLATSSSTAEHTADFDDDGRFVTWILHELSLTAAPAEERMPPVQLVRNQPLGTPAQSQPQDEQKRDASGMPRDTAVNPPQRASDIQEDYTMDFANMTAEEIIAWLIEQGVSMEELQAALQQAAAPATESLPLEGRAEGGLAPVAPVAPAPALPAAPQAPAVASDEDAQTAIAELLKKLAAPAPRSKPKIDITALRSQFARVQGEPPVEQPRRAAAPPPQITVDVPRKYADNNLQSMLFAHRVLRSRGQQLSNEFMQVLSGYAADAIAAKDPIIHNPYVRSVLKATRADEIMTSTNAGNGDEWVGVAYDGTLWEKARENRIYKDLVAKGMRVQEVPQGHESVIIFTEGSDPVVYTLTQTADLDATGRPTVIVPVTAPGTGQVALTPGYLGMAVAYSSVFEEDSLIAAAPQLNNQMNEKAEETIEQLMINGDTAASLNINYDGGSSTTQYWMASNGMRKYALLADAAAYARDGGALTSADFRATLKLFPGAIRTRKKNLMFITDADLYNTALDLTELKTDDVRTTGGTIRIGDFDGIYGVDLAQSGFMLLTASDGKVTFNAAGTVGQILAVYAPFWAMGWKRKVTIETDKDILSQTNTIVATFRLGFVPRGVGAATISYNLTIA
jgi:phage head maturation protease